MNRKKEHKHGRKLYERERESNKLELYLGDTVKEWRKWDKQREKGGTRKRVKWDFDVESRERIWGYWNEMGENMLKWEFKMSVREGSGGGEKAPAVVSDDDDDG